MKILNRILREIDSIASYLGLLIGIGFLGIGSILNSLTIIIFGILISSSCIIYLMCCRVSQRSDLTKLESPIQNHYAMFNVSCCLYFIILTLNLLITYVEQYSRPLIYFILIGILASIITAQILLRPLSKRSTYIILSELLLFGIFLRSTVYYLFPGYIGMDPWFHTEFSQLISQHGYLYIPPENLNPQFLYYVNFPLMHICCSVTSILTSLNIKDSLYISVGVIQVISALGVYSLAKYLYDETIGLLSAFLILIANYHIMWGFWIIPMSLAMAIAPFILLTFYKITTDRESTSNITLICLLLMITVAMIHPLSSFIILIALTLLSFSSILYEKVYPNIQFGESIITKGNLLILLFGLLLAGYWIYVSNLLNTHIEASLKNFFCIDILVVKSLENSALAEFADLLGLLMFFSLALIGTLYALNWRHQSKRRLRLVFAGWIIAAGVFLAQIAKLTSFLPDRWVPFVQILLSVPAGIGFLFISRRGNNTVATLITTVTITIVIVVSMYSYSGLHPDGSIQQFNEQNYRHSLTESEIVSGQFIEDNYNHLIGTDMAMGPLSHRFPNFTSMTVTYDILNRDYSNLSVNLIWLRMYITDHAFYHSDANYRGVERMSYDLIAEFETRKFDLIYDSSSVRGYRVDRLAHLIP